MITIKHSKDINSDIYQTSLAIRKEVFMNEQQVPASIEIADEEQCVHFVLYEDGVAKATVRLFPVDDQTFKVQRMAVLKENRKKGFGHSLLVDAENYAKKEGKFAIILGAQTHALAFYQKNGYETIGDEFLVSNIKHFNMKKTL